MNHDDDDGRLVVGRHTMSSGSEMTRPMTKARSRHSSNSIILWTLVTGGRATRIRNNRAAFKRNYLAAVQTCVKSQFQPPARRLSPAREKRWGGIMPQSVVRNIRGTRLHFDSYFYRRRRKFIELEREKTYTYVFANTNCVKRKKNETCFTTIHQKKNNFEAGNQPPIIHSK